MPRTIAVSIGLLLVAVGMLPLDASECSAVEALGGKAVDRGVQVREVARAAHGALRQVCFRLVAPQGFASDAIAVDFTPSEDERDLLRRQSGLPRALVRDGYALTQVPPGNYVVNSVEVRADEGTPRFFLRSKLKHGYLLTVPWSRDPSSPPAVDGPEIVLVPPLGMTATKSADGSRLHLEATVEEAASLYVFKLYLWVTPSPGDAPKEIAAQRARNEENLQCILTVNAGSPETTIDLADIEFLANRYLKRIRAAAGPASTEHRFFLYGQAEAWDARRGLINRSALRRLVPLTAAPEHVEHMVDSVPPILDSQTADSVPSLKDFEAEYRPSSNSLNPGGAMEFEEVVPSRTVKDASGSDLGGDLDSANRITGQTRQVRRLGGRAPQNAESMFEIPVLAPPDADPRAIQIQLDVRSRGPWMPPFGTQRIVFNYDGKEKTFCAPAVWGSYEVTGLNVFLEGGDDWYFARSRLSRPQQLAFVPRDGGPVVLPELELIPAAGLTAHCDWKKGAISLETQSEGDARSYTFRFYMKYVGEESEPEPHLGRYAVTGGQAQCIRTIESESPELTVNWDDLKMDAGLAFSGSTAVDSMISQDAISSRGGDFIVTRTVTDGPHTSRWFLYADIEVWEANRNRINASPAVLLGKPPLASLIGLKYQTLLQRPEGMCG